MILYGLDERGAIPDSDRDFYLRHRGSGAHPTGSSIPRAERPER
jgi:hypothetical protein